MREISETLVFAGAHSVFGLSDIARAVASLGFEARFIEGAFMQKYGLTGFPKDAPLVEYVDDLADFCAGLSITKSGTSLAAPAHASCPRYRVVPLSEFFISQCLALSGAGGVAGTSLAGTAGAPTEASTTDTARTSLTYTANVVTVSAPALKAARSKTLFYQTLAAHGIRVPRLYPTMAAAQAALDAGHHVLVKPDGLFSGYGVAVVQSTSGESAGIASVALLGAAGTTDKAGTSLAGADGQLADAPGEQEPSRTLEQYALKAASLTNNAIRLFGAKCDTALFSEYIAGTEYSADCFVHRGAVTVVRVCRKYITLIHHKPCTLAVEYLPRHTLDMELPGIADTLAAWCRALFAESDTSFAQFDFIVPDESKPAKSGEPPATKSSVTGDQQSAGTAQEAVPIDFAPRVGGGMEHLLHALATHSKDSETTDGNCYAAALENTARAKADKADISANEPRLFQYNFLPTVSGVLTALPTPPVPGEFIPAKKPGDYVTNNPGSARSKVAVLISSEPPSPATLHTCLLGAEYIQGKPG